MGCRCGDGDEMVVKMAPKWRLKCWQNEGKMVARWLLNYDVKMMSNVKQYVIEMPRMPASENGDEMLMKNGVTLSGEGWQSSNLTA